jgi:DNA-3-methyladenine glycosylase II
MTSDSSSSKDDEIRKLSSAFKRKVRTGVKHLRKQSPELDTWIEASGPCSLEIQWQRELFEALVRAIAHQQLHGRAAETILGRLVAGFRGEGFPSAQQVKRASHEKLRGMGFSTAKAVAIQGIAAAAAAGEIPTRAAAASMTDAELIERLLPLRGVGRWTVEMLLIFTLGRLDVMPIDDFGVKSGLQQLFGLESMPKKDRFAQLTDHWQPYRSLGAWYLWRKADAGKQK